MSDERIKPTSPHQQHPHPVEVKSEERESFGDGVSAAGVVEALRKTLAPGRPTEIGDNEVAPDTHEAEDTPAPQDYIEGDLR